MTPQEAKKMLKAKLECLKNETSGINHDCNMRLCDGCSLNYEQGNMGEQKEALDMAIKALEQQPITWIVGKDNCQVAVRNMPIDKMQKICAIIGEEEQQPSDDCISRQDAISAIQDKYYDNAIGIDIVDMIAHMPAAIPEQLGELFAEGYKKGIENE